MREGGLLVTGGSGVLGRVFVPCARGSGWHVDAPSRDELDLFDPAAVAAAVRGRHGVVHLATRIRPLSDIEKPELWRDNDRLRDEGSRLLTDAARDAGVEVYVQPTVTFVYPSEGRVDEETPIGEVPAILRSALQAERHTLEFAAAGRRGVVLRFGLLDGPGTGNDRPKPALGATLHVRDAATALLAALDLASGVYNACRDGERVTNAKLKSTGRWAPTR
jgi:nucleoside-diphosphate-sugar epimerase